MKNKYSSLLNKTILLVTMVFITACSSQKEGLTGGYWLGYPDRTLEFTENNVVLFGYKYSSYKVDTEPGRWEQLDNSRILIDGKRAHHRFSGIFKIDFTNQNEIKIYDQKGNFEIFKRHNHRSN